jgi:alpha-beta hydrolase superfamily lysophospholipase
MFADLIRSDPPFRFIRVPFVTFAPVKNKQKVFRWIKLVIICYCLIGTALYYLQDKLLLRPKQLAADSVYPFTQPFTETNIELDADTKLNIVQFTVPDSLKKGVVIYFHGNRENIGRYAKFAEVFTRNHYEVWMPDYPGFGKSTGTFTEKTVYDEAMQVYKMARSKYQPNQIIIYGKSMGTGIAAQLASVRDCKNLILETPYYSLTSLVRLVAFIYPVDLLLHYKMPTHDYLTKVTAPVSIFHGTDDGVVPYFNAARLKNVLKSTDEFITVEEGAHTNLYGFPLVQKKLDSLLQN